LSGGSKKIKHNRTAPNPFCLLLNCQRKEAAKKKDDPLLNLIEKNINDYV
jgi:hypothetical protein